MNHFSHTSEKRLATCHIDLQLIFTTAIVICPIDFGIAEGHRSVSLQLKYFNEGKSKIDGISRKGKHNYIPSLATDIYLWINGKTSYDKESLSYVMGFINGVAEMLLAQGKITHRLRWGGNWDMDGEILHDQSFDDRPHCELIKIK